MSVRQCTLDPETSDPTDNLTEQAVEFCQQVGSKASTVSDIVGKKDRAVYQAIEEGIQRVNRNAAARPYHIQKWAILQRDFSISGGELGRFGLVSLPAVCGAVWEGRGHGRAWEVPIGKQSWPAGVPGGTLGDRPPPPSRGRTLTAQCVGCGWESLLQVQGMC